MIVGAAAETLQGDGGADGGVRGWLVHQERVPQARTAVGFRLRPCGFAIRGVLVTRRVQRCPASAEGCALLVQTAVLAKSMHDRKDWRYGWGRTRGGVNA